MTNLSMILPKALQQLGPEKIYLPLPHGRASAWSFGAGTPVLCLHGFPDNCLTFRHQVKPLVQAGYRVILPVMRGYEPGSIQPDGRYYMADLAEDTVRWVDRIGVDKVHLVGHDWGAVSAWAAVGLAPERLLSVTSIAIPYLKHAAKGIQAHPQQLLNSWYMSFFQLRGLADWGVSAADWWFIKRLWKRWSPDYVAPPDVLNSVLNTFRQTGVKKAALGYYRCMYDAFSAPGRASHQLLRCAVAVPALLITGENDGCIDTRLFETTYRARDFLSDVQLERLSGAGHFAQLEKPDVVTGLLLDFFEKSGRS